MKELKHFVCKVYFIHLMHAGSMHLWFRWQINWAKIYAGSHSCACSFTPCRVGGSSFFTAGFTPEHSSGVKPRDQQTTGNNPEGLNNDEQRQVGSAVALLANCIKSYYEITRTK
jgi:hypothetical protein